MSTLTPPSSLPTTIKTVQVQADFSSKCVSASPLALPHKGAIIQMTACGLCGSDLDKIINQKAKPGMVLGHEVTGIIHDLCPEYDGVFQIGDRIVTSHHVPCLHCHYCQSGCESMCRTFKSTNLKPGGFSEYFSMTEGHLNHTAFKIPDTITDAEASCIEPLSCVVKAIRKSHQLTPDVAQQPERSATVIGLGFIGLMATQVYTQQGYQVTGYELNPERQQLALEQGFCTNVNTPPETLKHSMDTVFLSALSPQTLEIALTLVRDAGTLILFSSSLNSKSKPILDPDILYFREISVIPSYSPNLEDLRNAAELIFNQQINVQSLCTHTKPLDSFDEALTLYQSGEAIKVVITP